MITKSNLIVEESLSDKEIELKDSIREKYIHDLIKDEPIVQRDIMDILKLDNPEKLELIHEDRYINGIIADFTLIYDSKIRAIIECKAGDIGVTDYVRGIGQVMQYEYFNEQNVSHGREYSEEFNSILLVPSSVIHNNLMNIGRFKYPKSTLLFEINEVNKVTRQISRKELEELGHALDSNLTTISQYYVRDTRLYELYLLLKYLCFLKLKGVDQVNRVDLENEQLRKLQTQNNRNWRNAFISLSSLGLINSDNLPTPSGIQIGYKSYEEFISMMYFSYLKPYIDILMYCFSYEENLFSTNSKLCEYIREAYRGQDVLYLTQSDGRYMSSWLNLLRDDFGCLEFGSRSSRRELIYDISKLNEAAILDSIKKNTKAQEYIDRYKILTD